MHPPEHTHPARTLAELDRLRSRTRDRAHAGAWLPALGVATLLLASSLLYRTPFGTPTSITISHPYWAGLRDEQHDPVLSYVFWFVGIPLLFAATGAWYAWRARRLGLRVAWPVFAATGLGVLALLAVLAAVPERRIAADHLGAATPDFWWPGLLTPLLPVAAAVLALAWAERSVALAIAGGWIALLTAWLCGSRTLGYLPPWATRLLGGGDTSLGGELALRPGHYLVLMALPLVSFAAVRALRAARRTTRPVRTTEVPGA
ncbi:hypothetical protein [Plantactinospora sp. B5E13]|uniref:hypothetical protein n=1 Tax=unclassified Plantactinospora TaxID=2631981 RepID=UPI00325DAF66